MGITKWITGIFVGKYVGESCVDALGESVWKCTGWWGKFLLAVRQSTICGKLVQIVATGFPTWVR